MTDDERHMHEALREAQRAAEAGEVPVGAVVVHQGRILGRGRNRMEQMRDATAHAEMEALTQAAAALENWRLTGATLYVTVEPCPMCAAAALLSRVTRIVYGAADPRLGACGSRFDFLHQADLPAQIEIAGGVLGAECGQLIREFFRQRRSE